MIKHDVILVGGSLMGCAIAYYLLKADEKLSVALLEKDPTYARASTTLSDGNTRIQFNIKENILISRYGLEVLGRFSEEMAVGEQQPDIGFRQEGNLFLVDEAGREEALLGLALQQELGCRVEWLDPSGVVQLHPLVQSKGYVGGTFGPLDGAMDPRAVLLAYKNKALSMGAHFLHGRVTEIIKDAGRVTGVRMATGETLSSNSVVNTAGPWAADLAQTVGVRLPIRPVKRQVFVLETTARPAAILPALFFPSGLYLIHERAGHFMCGKSLPDDPVGYDFRWQEDRFRENLWPELVEYIPTFDRLKVKSGWAGLYAVNTFDGNAILGEWPGLKGFYLANGFSGHGFQQCHAVGRYLAELILDRQPTLDLSIFSPQRILDEKPVFESVRRLI